MTGSGIRSARFCSWVLLLSLCAQPAAGERQTAGGQPGTAQRSDVLLRAMRDELVRSTDTLQLEELERPYFWVFRTKLNAEHFSVGGAAPAVRQMAHDGSPRR